MVISRHFPQHQPHEELFLPSFHPVVALGDVEDSSYEVGSPGGKNRVEVVEAVGPFSIEAGELGAGVVVPQSTVYYEPDRS